MKSSFTLLLKKAPKPAGVAIAKVRTHPMGTGMAMKSSFTLLLKKAPKPAGVAIAKVRAHPMGTGMAMSIKKMKPE